MEGRFTQLFPDLPAAQFSEAALTALATQMTAEPDLPPTPETVTDAEENPGIPAGYTYFGQFIDHDLTLDPTSHLRQRLSSAEISALVDFRTPRFDLDCLYGRGPDDQPYLYAGDGVHLALGRPMSGAGDPEAADVPRAPNGRALIGDPRNDENRIVTQLQSTMIRFHNAVVDLLPGATFEQTREQVRWHYQWAVLHDFLPTIVQAQVIADVFPGLGGGGVPAPRYRIPALATSRRLPLMPVEFSVAAYRFGHSMIRPIYRSNTTIARRQIFSTSADPAGDLGGMRPIPLDWALDWRLFVPLGDVATVPTADDAVPIRPQLSYKIDTSLVNPLGLLPPSIARNPASLALRNLLRGATFGLPSGQDVADQLGVKGLNADEVQIGKATADAPKVLITDLSSEFAHRTPLWTYVLAEAHQTSWQAHVGAPDLDAVPIRLGPVGGHLIVETFAALMAADPTSVLHQPEFRPRPEFARQTRFGLPEIVLATRG